MHQRKQIMSNIYHISQEIVLNLACLKLQCLRFQSWWIWRHLWLPWEQPVIPWAALSLSNQCQVHSAAKQTHNVLNKDVGQ